MVLNQDTSVTTSSSDITIRGNLFNFSGYNPYIATTGIFTLEPVSTSTSFGQNVSTSSWSWNQNSQTLSGLTFGKSGNTGNITHETNALTVNGPVNFYGGNIYNNAALTVSGDVNFIASTLVDVNSNITKTSGSSATLTLTASSIDINADISSSSNALNLTSNAATMNITSNLSLNGGDLRINNSSNVTFSGTFSGSGNLYQLGAGQLTLSGNNSYSGTTHIYGKYDLYSQNSLGSGQLLFYNGSTLLASSGGAAKTISNNINLVSGSTTIDISFGTSSDFTLSGTISGSGKIVLTGDVNSRWVNLSGNNTFSGGIDINSSSAPSLKPIVRISNNSALGSGTITSYGTTNYSNIVFMGNYSVSNAFVINSSSTYLNFDTQGYTVTLSGVLSGAGTVSKAGSGTLNLSGASNNLTGDLVISAGELATSGSGRLASTYSGDISNSGTLNYGSSATTTSSGVISGSGTVKVSAGTLTLSGTNTYSGNTTISAGTIKLTGSVNALTDLTIASGATLDLQSTQTFATLDLDGTITRTANTSALTITGASDLGGSITTSGTQTYTGAITLTANTTLTSTSDAISASTIDGGYDLTIASGAAQSLTSAIGSSTALTSINVSTTSGNLTLGDDITVTGTGTDAMIFNAGSNTAAGTSTGGNIIISSSPTFTTGSGGRMTYYTGSISGSTGLTSLIGSGSNRFRYNSDETTTNYSAALSSGKYAIYREQPTLTITADDETVTYGTAPSESVTITGMQNGDASATVVTTDASISISGATSTSGNYIVGDHTITPSAAASTYGYGFSYSTGTLTVDAKALTIGGITASNKTYNGNTTATIDASAATFAELETGDLVTVSASGTFDNANVGTGKTVTLVETNAGDDVGNYTITDQGTTTANITAKTLTATASASNKVYDGTTTAAATLTFSDLVGSETLGQSVGATFADQNVDTGIVVTVNSITLSDGDNGGLATNYTISTGQTTTADITAKTLTATASASNKVYDGTTTAAATLTFSDLVGSETLGQSVGATFADQNVDTGIVVTVNSITLSDGDNGGLATNYTISTGQTTTANITAKTLTATASASNKVYDGTTTAAATLTFSDLVGSETLGQSVGATFADQNVDTGIVVTVNSITLSDGDNGGLATNYTISTGQTTTADITAKTLTATASASNKVYDGTTTASSNLNLLWSSG